VRRLAVNWLHLACLWTLGVCLPVFQVLSKSPGWLIAEHAGFPALPLACVLFVLLPPTAGITIEWAAYRADERAGGLVHLAAVACLVAAYVLQLLKDEFDPQRRSLILAALVVGAGFAFLYRAGRFLPSVLTVLSPATAVVLVWFLAFSGAAPRAWGTGAPSLDAPKVANPVPVVMVIFDEFSSLELLGERGRIDAARFPTFAALAQDATWYPNATTVADATIEAVPAILTGRLDRDSQPVEEDHPVNVFRLLEGQYDFHVHEPITHLCTFCDTTGLPARVRKLGSSLWTLTKQRLRPGDPANFLGIPQRTIRNRDDTFREWIAGVEGGRTFNLLHIQFPHTPWQYTPAGRQYTQRVVIPELTAERWTKDKGAVDSYLRRYVDQLRFTDRLIGELRSHMERRGIWDEALVVLVADHGVAFVPGGSRRFVELANFAEVASIPLFVKAPGQRRGGPSDALAQTVDVLPTIGDVLGTSWKAHGRSLRKPLDRERISVSNFFSEPLSADREGLMKLRRVALKRLEAALGAPPR
jgi:hypothetical protein